MTFLLGLWQVLRGSRKKMALAVACGLLFAGSGLLPPLLIRRIIQWTTEGGGTPQALTGIALLLLLVYLGRGACRYGYGRFSHEVSFDVLHTLTVRVYTHLQSLSHLLSRATDRGVNRPVDQRHRSGRGLYCAWYSGDHDRRHPSHCHDQCAVLS